MTWTPTVIKMGWRKAYLELQTQFSMRNPQLSSRPHRFRPEARIPCRVTVFAVFIFQFVLGYLSVASHAQELEATKRVATGTPVRFELEAIPPYTPFQFAGVSLREVRRLHDGTVRASLRIRCWMESMSVLVNRKPVSSVGNKSPSELTAEVEFSPGSVLRFSVDGVDVFGDLVESNYLLVPPGIRTKESEAGERLLPVRLLQPPSLHVGAATSIKYISYQQGDDWEWQQAASVVHLGARWRLVAPFKDFELYGLMSTTLFSLVKAPAGHLASFQDLSGGALWRYPAIPSSWGLAFGLSGWWASMSVPEKAYGYRNLIGPSLRTQLHFATSRRNQWTLLAELGGIGSSFGILPLENHRLHLELGWDHALRAWLGYRDMHLGLELDSTQLSITSEPISLFSAGFRLGIEF